MQAMVRQVSRLALHGVPHACEPSPELGSSATHHGNVLPLRLSLWPGHARLSGARQRASRPQRNIHLGCRERNHRVQPLDWRWRAGLEQPLHLGLPLTTTTSTTVPSLPARGATVYARLYSKVNGEVQYNDYTFTEPTSTPAAMTSPSAGNVLGASNQTFTWTAGTEITEYQLWLGLRGPGSSSLYNSGWLTTTSVTVPSVPARGAAVYARLYSYGNGGLQWSDYVFNEEGAVLLSAFSCASASMTGSGTDACTVTPNAPHRQQDWPSACRAAVRRYRFRRRLWFRPTPPAPDS